MLRKIYSIVALVCFSSFAFAQTGTLKGVINDAISGEPIPFAPIYMPPYGLREKVLPIAQTDMNGFWEAFLRLSKL